MGCEFHQSLDTRHCGITLYMMTYIQLRPDRTKLKGRPYHYVGAGVRCIDLCYHNRCFCFLNVISNGMYQYKHDALFSFLNLSIKIVVVDVDDIIFDKWNLLLIYHPKICAFLEATELGSFFFRLNQLLAKKQRMNVFLNPLVYQFFSSYFFIV